jgi:dTDP-4-amino-4,6-dideoxygalactose transaminase
MPATRALLPPRLVSSAIAQRDRTSTKGRTDFLIFGQPLIEQTEIDEVVDSLKKGWLGTGPKVARFENEFALYKSAPAAVAVNSCTAALHLSMLVAGVQPGDEVITTAMTFCATVNAIIHAGAIPVLADVDPRTMCIDPVEVEARITPRTRAIAVVHFGGHPCEMDTLTRLATKHGLKLIEDCAHAIETEYRGKKVGLFGDFGCFSFYATKNVCTGEGGMILARAAMDVQRLKMLALHGMSHDAWRRYSDDGFKHYQVVECGYKYNMMDLQAAIGIHQLARVEKCWERRRELAMRYRTAFANLPIELPAAAPAGCRHGHHLFPILVDETRAGISRDSFIEAMTARKLGVGVHYLSVAEHPYYQEAFGWKAHDYSHARRIGRETVSLPLSPRLTDEDVDEVIDAVGCILGG